MPLLMSFTYQEGPPSSIIFLVGHTPTSPSRFTPSYSHGSRHLSLPPSHRCMRHPFSAPSSYPEEIPTSPHSIDLVSSFDVCLHHKSSQKKNIMSSSIFVWLPQCLANSTWQNNIKIRCWGWERENHRIKINNWETRIQKAFSSAFRVARKEQANLRKALFSKGLPIGNKPGLPKETLQDSGSHLSLNQTNSRGKMQALQRLSENLTLGTKVIGLTS